MEKKHYEVYYVGRGTGCYAQDYKKIFLGDTWAVSEKQACNFVRYRFRDKQRPHGGYAIDILGDSLNEGFVEYTFKAVEV